MLAALPPPLMGTTTLPVELGSLLVLSSPSFVNMTNNSYGRKPKHSAGVQVGGVMHCRTASVLLRDSSSRLKAVKGYLEKKEMHLYLSRVNCGYSRFDTVLCPYLCKAKNLQRVLIGKRMNRKIIFLFFILRSCNYFNSPPRPTFYI